MYRIQQLMQTRGWIRSGSQDYTALKEARKHYLRLLGEPWLDTDVRLVKIAPDGFVREVLEYKEAKR